jgi:hypothetical protein
MLFINFKVSKSGIMLMGSKHEHTKTIRKISCFTLCGMNDMWLPVLNIRNKPNVGMSKGWKRSERVFENNFMRSKNPLD